MLYLYDELCCHCLPVYSDGKPISNCHTVSLTPFLFHLILNRSPKHTHNSMCPSLPLDSEVIAKASFCLLLGPLTHSVFGCPHNASLPYFLLFIIGSFSFLYSAQGLTLCPASNGNSVWMINLLNICCVTDTFVYSCNLIITPWGRSCYHPDYR